MSESRGVIAITGASRGIGREAAIHAASLGFDVLIGFNSKEKRAKELQAEIAARSRGVHTCRTGGDLTEGTTARQFAREALNFADRRGSRLAAVILNAAGGLEPGANIDDARAVNIVAPLRIADEVLAKLPTTSISYVTSHPSHFWGIEGNVMPIAGYEVVAETKHEAEEQLRALGADVRVATADLVRNTTGAMLIQRKYRQLYPGRDIFDDRDSDLLALVGRRTTSAIEFGRHIIEQVVGTHPSGHTLYLPQYLLGEGPSMRPVTPTELPFGVGSDPTKFTFVY